jgi:hypothetical protein
MAMFCLIVALKHVPTANEIISFAQQLLASILS